MDWQDFKCRCSAITNMLSEKQGFAALTELQVIELADLEKKPTRTPKQAERITELVQKREKSKEIVLSDTCIAYLMEHYAWVTQKMISVTKEMDIDAMTKGKIQEPEGIALLSIVDGKDYTKYDGERISNDYLTGLPDIFEGTEIYKATKITDLKCSFDYPCFLKKINTLTDQCNKTQIQGYMDITGANEGEVADVLVDMPETIINDYRRRLLYRMQDNGSAITEESPAYVIAWMKMEGSMRFEGKIPRHQRVFKKLVIPFTEFEKQKIHDKVKICRTWLNSFHEMYIKLNK